MLFPCIDSHPNIESRVPLLPISTLSTFLPFLNPFLPPPLHRLIYHIAIVSTSHQNGKPPLFTAAENGNLKSCEVLLSYKCNTEVVSSDNITPLAIACDKGHHKVIKFLVEKQARTDVKVKSGKTLVEAVVTSIKEEDMKFEVVKFLLAHGCKVDDSTLEALKNSLPSEQRQRWENTIKAAHEERAKNFSKAIGDAAPVPTDVINNAPMDDISKFLGFEQPLQEQQ